MSNRPLPARQVHLDFHTGPQIPGVGAHFDAKAFAQTFVDAHVDSVTVFAKCHHGHLYYDTPRPERHPGLAAGVDLLRQQVDALHAVGIRAPIYISVQCDEYAANTHPEWVARQPNGAQVKWGESVFKPGWQILDMATGYQDYLFDQTREILERFKPVDGIFFDMCWDQPSTTGAFISQMRAAGLQPESEADRKRHAHHLALAYMKRFHDLVKAHSPEGSCYFNSRPLNNLAEEAPYLTQIEIEALPTGGWGYMYFPKNVRFARMFGRPYLGMTARFHKSWADFGGLKPYAALEYETSQMMAHGAKCSIGDQLHPTGRLDVAAYDLIRRVYERVAAREPWLESATPLSEVGLFLADVHPALDAGTVDDGATRMLTQLKVQFDIVPRDADWSRYALLILPDTVIIDDTLGRKLQQYVQQGGSILATGFSGVSADGSTLQFPPLGVAPLGVSPYTTTYLRFGETLSRDVPPTDHVMYDPGIRIRPLNNTTAFGQVVEPYFERAWDHFCSHHQTPGDRATDYPIATLAGKVAYIPFPIFAAFAKHGNYPYRLLVRNLMQQLGVDPLIRVQGPTGMEVTATRQGDRTIVHLLYYTPERRTKDLDIVEDIVPLHDIPLSIRLPHRPTRAYLAPQMQELPLNWIDGRAEVTVPAIAGHGMVVFE